MPGKAVWTELAACAAEGIPTDWFFPDGRAYRTPGETEWDKGKAVCAGCPVRERCLEEALAKPEVFGLWGGLSPSERWELSADIGRQMRHGTYNGYRAHCRHHVPLCEPCRAAKREHSRMRAAEERERLRVIAS